MNTGHSRALENARNGLTGVNRNGYTLTVGKGTKRKVTKILTFAAGFLAFALMAMFTSKDRFAGLYFAR